MIETTFGENVNILEKAIKDFKIRAGLDSGMLKITDFTRNKQKDLAYNPMPDGTFLAVGMVSRKKQVSSVVPGLWEA